ncbi:DUF4178 domain-containing protein [uncultured Tenacibaculum sp.]|uniref:DUF4178 domain-containing protein n=1 Tax=uncultured Tenacibaculum sp. TaxID=174713 RepID=UPI002601670E|nr:DUF4178 domain-containing protein [uncultured Tenacibaculum sp.]
MGFFDLFKNNKKEEEKHYDPIDIKVTDLENGYLLDYDLETWTVTKMSEYDWGDSHFSREFLIESKGKKCFLHIEEDDELIISLSEELKYRKLGPTVTDYIDTNGKPPKQIVHQDITYYLDEEAPGYYRNVENENWEELISFYYLDEDEEKCLTIEQWGEEDFEASIGKILKSYEISNILPSYNE